MDKGFKGKLGKKKEDKPNKSKSPSLVKKTLFSWWKVVCRKKMLIFDVAVFVAAAGAIYAFGDKISKLFTEQLPVEDSPSKLPIGEPEI